MIGPEFNNTGNDLQKMPEHNIPHDVKRFGNHNRNYRSNSTKCHRDCNLNSV
ncbi:hypothetical protein SAMN05192553_102949 [Cyclobacterium xiamenense]|uniref:Uncharacterized protein n=1 Tax=Cyclobacterium xiamenense TaxID=1297121 RepID=A0A1H6WZC3_9BACT|nr:hypothetical protein SAMN05192553_102949 [Cyclobacterium xiamenense]